MDTQAAADNLAKHHMFVHSPRTSKNPGEDYVIICGCYSNHDMPDWEHHIASRDWRDEAEDEYRKHVVRSVFGNDIPLEYGDRWVIPAEVAGQQLPVVIGRCVYHRYPGWFAYEVHSEFNAKGLLRDGTWSKYGASFDSPQAAYAALLGCTEQAFGPLP